MKLEDLFDLYQGDSRVAELSRDVVAQPGIKLQTANMPGAIASLTCASLYKNTSTPQFIVLNDKEEAAYFLNDLEKLITDQVVFFYPGSYRRPYEIEETNNANVLLRAEVLNRINSRKNPPIIVTYPEALFERVITRNQLNANTLKIKEGDSLGIDFLNETLFEYRFEHVDFVTGPGQFSVRGGIVDVFSFSNDLPYRIEFFDDDVDSIRTFDIETQLTEKKLKQMEIIPNVENKEMLEVRESIFDYIPDNSVLWFKSVEICGSNLDMLFEKAESAYVKLSSDIKHAQPSELFINDNTLKEALGKYTVIELGSDTQLHPEKQINFGGKPQPSFNKNFDLLTETFQLNTDKNWKNYVLCSSQKQVERFYSIFDDIGKKIEFQPILGALHEGFEDPQRNLVCFTDHQIFERYQRFKLKTGYDKQEAITIKELNSLQYGDYVTHIDHGVGRFGGLQKIENSGKTQEAIKLTYKDGDTLYVSIHSLHKISRFSGKEGTEPKINKLGSPAWQNLKKKTKKKVKEIAFDLIQLYAKRKSAKGFAFAPDSYLQHELEASFLFEDTPDQLKATQDVKGDMEKLTPMDRLVCGDVGFGKTEVAIRAAFKAATDGKQVAILVPTTILAFQHFKTFSKRLKDFPVTVDYLNRFKSTGKQKETIQNLKDGKVDIVIGTHRLVSKDVEFKDLGLLIIDEEQKFGVAVKDKLKTIKVDVDTLTLTATPIPRTLQFSLMAARDLSVINTPPPNRQPIETHVVGFNEETLRDAVMYEISRGGQVFFIHNRIENIHEVAGVIQRLVPDAKIGVGHGQMEGKKLEQLMLNFMEGDFDVLVSTTIIESGLDVPNANTIIINSAQNFGLSDLHQMRGRVGRSNKKAFCKLVSPPISSLTDEARKRLQTLEQFTDLGSGFKIAMRDLEIRGAGDILGGDQTGFINEIGFDAYQKIMAEAVKELKETEFKELYKDAESDNLLAFLDECQLDTDLELMIPDEYVNNIEERLRLYQELDAVKNEEELKAYELAIQDRFGPIPNSVKELLTSMRLRWIGQQLGMEKIVLKMGKMIGYFIANQESDFFQSEQFNNVLLYLRDHPREAQMKQRNEKLTLVFEGVNKVDLAIQKLSGMLLKKK